MSEGEGSKLHIDADWKAAAAAEKERLSQQEQTREAKSDQPGYPEANLKSLIDVLASQAIMSLGAVADPQTGRAVVDPHGAKFAIDLLGVLEEKTEGQRDEEETQHLKMMLSELRTRFVQIMDLIAKQGAEPVEQPGGTEATPKIETPGN